MNHRYPSYEFNSVSFEDNQGHRVDYGPSRIVVEPLDARQKTAAEIIADRIIKGFVLAASLYLVAEIFRCIADGAFKGLSL